MAELQDNPYSAMLHTIRMDTSEHTVEPWRLGRVTSVFPLTVEMAGVTLAAGNLLVNHQLRSRREEIELSGVYGSLGATNDCGTCSMSSLDVSSGSLEAEAMLGGVLELGDQVVLLQSGDGQQFVVLCKVVSA